MRGITPIDSDTWKQFRIGLYLMLPWPIGAAALQPLNYPVATDPSAYLLYLIGMSWSLIWDPVAKIQEALPPIALNVFTISLIAILTLMWLTVAALPLLGRWPGKQAIGLWAMQCAFAGSQAIGGYFYAKSFIF